MSLRRFFLRLASRRLLSSSDSGGRRAVAAAGDGDGGGGGGGDLVAAEARREAYKQMQNLDFPTAVKILFTVPPKRKKFGLDFHLVQLFFTCMPSLAVYLVAQYARYEIRRMEAEVEEKKKQAEEEEKAKQAELMSVEEDTDSKLSKVIVRLETLEEVVKEIVDDKKKAPSDKIPDSSNVKASESTASKNKDSGSSPNPSVNITAEEGPRGHPRNVENGEKASGESKT